MKMMIGLHIENIFLELYLNVIKNYELFVLSALFSEYMTVEFVNIFFIASEKHAVSFIIKPLCMTLN